MTKRTKTRKKNQVAVGPLSAAQEKLVAGLYGVSIKEVMRKREKAWPPEVVSYACELMTIAISAATKAAILRKRGVLSSDTEGIVRRIVGHVGVLMGKGTFEETFTSLTVLGEEDEILARSPQKLASRTTTKTLRAELFDDLARLEKAGREIEEMILKKSGNYLLESSYLSIACYIQGLAQSARAAIGKTRPG